MVLEKGDLPSGSSSFHKDAEVKNNSTGPGMMTQSTEPTSCPPSLGGGQRGPEGAMVGPDGG